MSKQQRGRAGDGEKERRTQYSVLSTQHQVLLVVVASIMFPDGLEAETVLRWKLKRGESLSVHAHQVTESNVGFAAKSARTTIEDDLYLTWEVVAAEDDACTIRQKIDRIIVNMTGRESAAVQFDSSSTARPVGQAASLASGLKPLIGAEFEIKMTARGEVLAVNPLNEAAKGLFAAEERTAESAGTSRGSLRQVLSRPLVVLPPEEISTGGTWTTENKITTAAGAISQQTGYQLRAINERDGKSIYEIEAKSKLVPEAVEAGKSGSKIRIQDQQQSEVIQFSASDGRPIEIEQTQKLVTERQYRETTIVVTLNRTQKTTITASP